MPNPGRDSLPFEKDLAIVESDHAQAAGFKETGPRFIMLSVPLLGVLAPVQLDDELSVMTVEIQDVRSKVLRSTKFEACQLA